MALRSVSSRRSRDRSTTWTFLDLGAHDDGHVLLCRLHSREPHGLDATALDNNTAVRAGTTGPRGAVQVRAMVCARAVRCGAQGEGGGAVHGRFARGPGRGEAGGKARVDHRGESRTRPFRAVRRTRSPDHDGSAERDRSVRDDAERRGARVTDGRGGAVHRRHIRQPVGAVHPAPDPDQQQPEARVHAPVPGHQRLHRAHRHVPHVRRENAVAARQEGRVDVPVPGPVAVLRAELRLRGHRHGRRTLAGPHQTVFLPTGTYCSTAV